MIIDDVILSNAIKTADNGSGSCRATIAAKLGSAVIHICIRDGGPVPRKVRMNATRIENAFVRAAAANTLGLIYIEVQTTNLYFNTLEPEKIDFADWAMPLFAYDNFGGVADFFEPGEPFSVLFRTFAGLTTAQVIFFPVHKEHHIGVLLDGP